MLTVLGLCNQDSISLLYGSDINENMVECAKKNLSLVSLQGINFRIQELVVVRSKYQKEVHQKAYESAMALKEIIIREITTEIFCADATQRISIPEKADIMIADVPYGKTVSWHGDENSLNHMMDQLANVASENCILAVSMDKSQRPRSNHWKRLEK